MTTPPAANARPPRSPDATPTSTTAADFSGLPLPPPLLANLATLGYTAMTPIQTAALPVALSGRDLVAQAQTGSGKTAAFGLALLSRLRLDRSAYAPPGAAPDTDPRAPGTEAFSSLRVQALVLCPTRELADQVTTEIRRLARTLDNIKVVTLCGGVPLRGQVASLGHGAHVVVGTPGRVLDHLDRGNLSLGGVHTLVLDEADRMLDMGFVDDMARVAAQCPTDRQTLLFSATFPDDMAALTQRFLRQPAQVAVAAPAHQATIEQRWYEVTDDQRLHTVGQLLAHVRPVSTLAFCNTKAQCRDLVDVLRAQGHSALALYGDLEQRERDQVLVRFANQSCAVLVATDVAARGLDVAGLACVINVDVAIDAATHVHRIGRTGRAGATGLALNLASLDEMGHVGRIEQRQGHDVTWHPLADATPTGTGPLVPARLTLHLQGGRKEKIRPGDVLGALTADLGYTREQVGKINVNDWSTYVALDRDIAHPAADRLNASRIKGKRVKARVLDD